MLTTCIVLTTGLALWSTQAASDAPFDLGFREGTAPLSAADWRSAESCGGCHPDELAAWQGSRHRVAHSNPIYVAGLMAEPKVFCVNCHSPFPQQAGEVLANLDWYRAHDPRNGLDPTTRTRAPEPHAGEGITCATCHVRGDEVLSAFVSGAAPHKSREVPALATAALCESCHQFRMPHWRDGELTFTETPMQATASEHAAWRKAGGEAQCQDCHMPAGAHVFRGAHDREWLAQSVAVTTARDTDGKLVFTIQSEGVGHSLPSGDLFRRITLSVEGADGFSVVDTMAKHWQVQTDPVSGETVKRLVGDTTLQPGTPRTVTVDAAPGARWRLAYHYGSDTDERRGLVPLEDLIATLLEGAG